MFAHPTHTTKINPRKIPGIGPGAVTVPHSSEIPYVFGATELLQDGEEANLAIPMASYWTNFAKTGNPNGTPNNGQASGQANGATTLTMMDAETSSELPSVAPSEALPTWPAYTAAGDVVMRMAAVSEGGIHVQTGLRKVACDWSDKHPRMPIKPSVKTTKTTKTMQTAVKWAVNDAGNGAAGVVQGAVSSPPAGWATCGALAANYSHTACPSEEATCCKQKWMPSEGAWGCCPYKAAVCW